MFHNQKQYDIQALSWHKNRPVEILFSI